MPQTVGVGDPWVFERRVSSMESIAYRPSHRATASPAFAKGALAGPSVGSLLLNVNPRTATRTLSSHLIQIDQYEFASHMPACHRWAGTRCFSALVRDGEVVARGDEERVFMAELPASAQAGGLPTKSIDTVWMQTVSVADHPRRVLIEKFKELIGVPSSRRRHSTWISRSYVHPSMPFAVSTPPASIASGSGITLQRPERF